MRRQEKNNNGNMQGIQPYKGERLETYVARCTSENTPIENTAPMRYTERDLGVVDDFNHRADKWEKMQKIATETALNTRVMMDPTKNKEKFDELTGKNQDIKEE